MVSRTESFCSLPVVIGLNTTCLKQLLHCLSLSNVFFLAHSSLHSSLLILPGRLGLKYCVKHAYSTPKRLFLQSSISPKKKFAWHTWSKGTTKLSQQKWAHYNTRENPRIMTEQRGVWVCLPVCHENFQTPNKVGTKQYNESIMVPLLATSVTSPTFLKIYMCFACVYFAYVYDCALYAWCL